MFKRSPARGESGGADWRSHRTTGIIWEVLASKRPAGAGLASVARAGDDTNRGAAMR